MIFVLSTIAILMTSLLVQTIPASGLLEKRDFGYLTDQHLTASLGNNKVCGDHMCGVGEWSKLQENLNKAQVGHGLQTNMAKSVPLSAKINSTSIKPVQMNASAILHVPTQIPTPTAAPYSVCKAVKGTLANYTVSSSVVAKIMADLNCS
jgi:hypothetical protein